MSVDIVVVDTQNNKVFRVSRTVNTDSSEQLVSVDDNLVNFSGRVVDSAGLPIPGLRMYLNSASGGGRYGGGLSDSGFVSRWLPKGDYYLPCLYKSEPVTTVSGEAKSRSINFGCLRGPEGVNTFTLDSNLSIDWVLNVSTPVLRTVKVHVLDPAGQPAVNAQVSGLLDVGFNTAATGSFKIGSLETSLVANSVSYPASFSQDKTYSDSYGTYVNAAPVTWTTTDSNGDFYVYTYAPAVSVSVTIKDPKTNVLKVIPKTIYSGVLTPVPLSLDSVDVGSSSATLIWTYPDEYGPISLSDFVIQEYDESSNGWKDLLRVKSDKRSVVINKLASSSYHRYRILATSDVGRSQPSSETQFSTPAAIFEAPVGLRVDSIKTNSAKLYWSTPAQKSNLKGYVLEYSLDTVTWTPALKTATKSTSISLSGLNLGTAYSYRVAATDGSALGDYAYVDFRTAALVPAAPRSIMGAEVSSSSFKINWVPPTSNGGSEISDYVVEINGGGFNWTPVAHSPSISTSMNITGLNPGVKYSVRVKAVNGVGVSKVSSTLSVTTLAVLPSSPVVTLKSVTATGAVLNWVAPANGGAKISDYKVEYSTDGGNTWLTVSKSASTSTSLTLKNLKTKTSYLFRVSAKNSVGYSAPSSNLIVATP